MTNDFETPPLPWAGDPGRTCRHCGLEEPNEYLLQINHGNDSATAERDGICIAMGLTRTHVLNDIQRVLDSRSKIATLRLRGQPTKAADGGLNRAQTALKLSIARARDVWPDLTWLTEALDQMGD